MKIKKISQPHIKQLTQLVERWRSETGLDVPYFDPDDGGVSARILFLMEKPGPGASKEKGSGFISQDNNDPTAKTVKCFLEKAGIPRSEIVIWNTVATWNGTRKILKNELDRAPSHLCQLLVSLKNLTTIVCVGKKAEKALKKMNSAKLLEGYRLATSLHPSPINRNKRYAEWSEIPSVWRQAAQTEV